MTRRHARGTRELPNIELAAQPVRHHTPTFRTVTGSRAGPPWACMSSSRAPRLPPRGVWRPFIGRRTRCRSLPRGVASFVVASISSPVSIDRSKGCIGPCSSELLPTRLSGSLLSKAPAPAAAVEEGHRAQTAGVASVTRSSSSPTAAPPPSASPPIARRTIRTLSSASVRLFFSTVFLSGLRDVPRRADAVIDGRPARLRPFRRPPSFFSRPPQPMPAQPDRRRSRRARQIAEIQRPRAAEASAQPSRAIAHPDRLPARPLDRRATPRGFPIDLQKGQATLGGFRDRSTEASGTPRRVAAQARATTVSATTVSATGCVGDRASSAGYPPRTTRRRCQRPDAHRSMTVDHFTGRPHQSSLPPASSDPDPFPDPYPFALGTDRMRRFGYPGGHAERPIVRTTPSPARQCSRSRCVGLCALRARYRCRHAAGGH